jgi:hypothetical protein
MLTIDSVLGLNGETVYLVSDNDEPSARISETLPKRRRLKTAVPFSRQDYAVKRGKVTKAGLRSECATLMGALRFKPLFLVHYDRLDYQREDYPCPKYYKTITDLTAHRNFLEMITEFYEDFDRNKGTNFAVNWQTRNGAVVLP